MRLAERLQRPTTLHPLQHVAIGILWEQAEAILATLAPSTSAAGLDRTIRETFQLLEQVASSARASGRDDLLSIVEERKVELTRIIGRLEQKLDPPAQARIALEGIRASLLTITRLSGMPAPRGTSPKNDPAPRDPYEVLIVGRTASREEIRSAYLGLAKLYHPDKVSHLAPEFQALAGVRMRELNAALDALSGTDR